MYTVLIPCNKVHPWLKKCLLSLKTYCPYDDFEVLIVINNALEEEVNTITEISREILPFVKVLNSGFGSLSKALNYGILNSKHNFIVRMDSDDELRKGRIEKQISILEQNSDIAAVGTFVQIVSETGKPGKIITFPTDSSEINKLLSYGNCISHPTVTFNKEHVISVGMYSEDYPHAEDYDLWLKLSHQFKLVNVPLVGINYRTHSGQVSQLNLAEQVLSTRQLSTREITYRIEKAGLSISSNDSTNLSSTRFVRCESSLIRLEKARLEMAQLRGFHQSLTWLEVCCRVCTILANDPYVPLSWIKQKILRFVRGRHEG